MTNTNPTPESEALELLSLYAPAGAWADSLTRESFAVQCIVERMYPRLDSGREGLRGAALISYVTELAASESALYEESLAAEEVEQ